MTDTPPKLPLKDAQGAAVAHVKEFLEEAKSFGLLDCVIIGSMPGNQYRYVSSSVTNRVELLGYIELAKLELFHDMKE